VSRDAGFFHLETDELSSDATRLLPEKRLAAEELLFAESHQALQPGFQGRCVRVDIIPVQEVPRL
jgi:hypothetical protein